MKKISLLILGVIMSVGIMAQDKNFKKYPFESAIIEYSIQGNTNGSKTIYIDQYGYLEAVYTETSTKMMGITTKENTVVISKGAKVYSLDKSTGTATVSENPYHDAFAETGEDYIELGENMLKSMGYSKTGSATVLGKDCEIWEGMNKIWIWKGLTLKMETNMMGMSITETATNLDMDAGIPASKFTLPEGTEIIETDASMPGMPAGF